MKEAKDRVFDDINIAHPKISSQNIPFFLAAQCEGSRGSWWVSPSPKKCAKVRVLHQGRRKGKHSGGHFSSKVTLPKRRQNEWRLLFNVCCAPILFLSRFMDTSLIDVDVHPRWFQVLNDICKNPLPTNFIFSCSTGHLQRQKYSSSFGQGGKFKWKPPSSACLIASTWNRCCRNVLACREFSPMAICT